MNSEVVAATDEVKATSPEVFCATVVVSASDELKNTELVPSSAGDAVVELYVLDEVVAIVEPELVGKTPVVELDELVDELRVVVPGVVVDAGRVVERVDIFVVEERDGDDVVGEMFVQSEL